MDQVSMKKLSGQFNQNNAGNESGRIASSFSPLRFALHESHRPHINAAFSGNHVLSTGNNMNRREFFNMNPREFFINPADDGLPTRDELVAYRIWDNHLHGLLSPNDPIEQYERNGFFVERMGIERAIAQKVNGRNADPRRNRFDEL
jgi:hypothetical protein